VFRKRVLEVVFVYDLRMIGRIGECRVIVVEILLQPVREREFLLKKGGFRGRTEERKKREKRRGRNS